MVLETALLISGLLTTVAIGGPMMSSLVRPYMFRRPAPRDRAQFDRGDTQHHAVFTPLDLGPDPTQWPSARPWEGTTTRFDQVWPSTTWDDEHFGRHWRDNPVDETVDLGFHAMAGRRYDASVSDEEQVRRNLAAVQQRAAEAARARAARRGGLVASPGPTVVSAAAPGAATPSRTAHPRRGREAAHRSRGTPSGGIRRDVRAASSTETLPVRQPPSRAELEAMISDVGLAGTVQAIMERTGWDFRKAAQYLARVRQGG